MSGDIVILHNPVPEDAHKDEADVLIQAREISKALAELGYTPHMLPFSLSSQDCMRTLNMLVPLCVFNIVESLEGDGRLIHVACSYLDHLGIPYTGAPAEAMFLTSHKVLAKRWMLLNEIPTPEWIGHGPADPVELPLPAPCIIKALWEEASIGLDESSVVMIEGPGMLKALVEKRSEELKTQCFAERFIDGREFNLSLLATTSGVEVLPPAEIVFDFPEHKARIVDYRAKWDEASPEYKDTQRSFEFSSSDEVLLGRLKETALKCWRYFDLRGYARVDFRVDTEGLPYVLEINANPCISPDSGFVAAAHRSGITYGEVIERILADSLSAEQST
ncbi:MAG TPA: D-alanine--D-alanine ligase [Deltaproteobacteria bacterium]|nr:D-alanine--D-alanine ligase [Deltaproteobacteria bacterium]